MIVLAELRHSIDVTMILVVGLLVLIAWAAVHYLPPPAGWIVAGCALVAGLLYLVG